MRAPLDWFVAACVTAGVAATATLGGCGHGTAPDGTQASATPTIPSGDAHSQLSARAAAAKDRRFIAGYTLVRGHRPVQAVLVTIANDRTWRVDVQGGALGGTTDVAIIGRSDGQYQCDLSKAGRGCVRVATSDESLPAAIDPQVQYPFTRWLRVLTDPRVAVSVATTSALPNVTGMCYSVEPTAVTLAPPIQSAVFCYAEDGVLTGVRAGFGTMTLSSTPAAAPASVRMPGPVVLRAPLPIAAPPPAPTRSAASTSASPARR